MIDQRLKYFIQTIEQEVTEDSKPIIIHQISTDVWEIIHYSGNKGLDIDGLAGCIRLICSEHNYPLNILIEDLKDINND